MSFKAIVELASLSPVKEVEDCSFITEDTNFFMSACCDVSTEDRCASCSRYASHFFVYNSQENIINTYVDDNQYTEADFFKKSASFRSCETAPILKEYWGPSIWMAIHKNCIKNTCVESFKLWYCGYCAGYIARKILSSMSEDEIATRTLQELHI